jgi:hypothetical protein
VVSEALGRDECRCESENVGFGRPAAEEQTLADAITHVEPVCPWPVRRRRGARARRRVGAAGRSGRTPVRVWRVAMPVRRCHGAIASSTQYQELMPASTQLSLSSLCSILYSLISFGLAGLCLCLVRCRAARRSLRRALLIAFIIITYYFLLVLLRTATALLATLAFVHLARGA